ncbi:MAG: pentapeptide repeat-containing protein, partial [Fibromonadales bacterium]|nr:pentapeptide repeat-containing protein [Fibromonadales bacterium]
MDDRKIQIGNYQWTSIEVVEEFTDEKLEGSFFSWGEFSTPTRYIGCNGSSLAMRKCTIISQIFIECNFDFIDASDSIFIDCLFVNCSFKNANFHNANFIGTAIIQDGILSDNEMFKGAGMSQIKFKKSNSNNSVLSKLNLGGCGFRHSVFENVIISEVSTEHTSFENAYFSNCIIDCFNLRKSACRGIIVDNCKIGKYFSSLEKVLGGIGILQTLKQCDNFELNIGDHKIDKLSELWKMLKEVSNNFVSDGRLFEFINIINYLYTKKQ